MRMVYQFQIVMKTFLFWVKLKWFSYHYSQMKVISVDGITIHLCGKNIKSKILPGHIFVFLRKVRTKDTVRYDLSKEIRDHFVLKAIGKIQ